MQMGRTPAVVLGPRRRGLVVAHGMGGVFDAAAIFAFSDPAGRYRFGGADYASKTALLTAAGGSFVGTTLKLGPVAIGASVLANSDPVVDTAGWTGYNSGTLDVVSGQLRVTGNSGASASGSRLAAVTSQRTYILTGMVTRPTGSSGPQISISNNASLAGAYKQANAIGVFDTPTELTVIWGAIQASVSVGVKMNANPSLGTALLGTFRMREAAPLTGLTAGVVSYEAEITVPAATAGDQVLLAFDSDDVVNSVSLAIDSSGHLVSRAVNNSVAAAVMDMGAVSAGQIIRVSGTSQTGQNFIQIDDQPVVKQNRTVATGAMMRVERDFTGNAAPAGSVRKLQIFAGERMPAGLIRLEGDSYVDGSADGTSLTKSIQTATPRRAFSTGAGGSTLTQQRDRMLALTGFLRHTLVHWDGAPNGYGTLSADMAKYAAMLAAVTHGRVLFVTPVVAPASASDINAAAVALRTELLATYPNNVFDAQAFIDALSDVWQADNAHLKASIMDQVAVAIIAWLAARGW